MWSLDVTWQSINVMSSLPQELQALILAEWWLSLKVFLLPSHMSLWSFDHYILFYKACEHQIQQSGDLGSHPTVTWPLINLSLDAMWQTRTVTYQLLQELLRVLIKVTGSHPLNHMIFSLCGQMRSQDKLKSLYLLFHQKFVHQTLKGRGSGWGAPSYQVILPLNYKITCKRNIQIQIQIFILLDSRTTKFGWMDACNEA